MNKIRDGDLYKSVEVFGKIFNLYYGYYTEEDRQSAYAEPIPVYPNFYEKPQYTDDGYPFATEMQDVCEYYSSNIESDYCYLCSHFKKGTELIGLCSCKERRQKNQR